MNAWGRLYGIALGYVGSEEALKGERHILKRLFVKFGPEDVERMIRGAQLLGWRSLVSLGSKEGVGRRWALEAYWRTQNQRGVRMPEIIKQVMREAGQ